MRQRGKVAELALGFLGGVGALQAMAAGYGMHFTDDEARPIVDGWRAANPWAASFGEDLWDAMLQARETPGHPISSAGRVGFIFLSGLPRRLAAVRLPSGRMLTYRALRWEKVDVHDDDDKPRAARRELTFARGHGRVKLWPGMLVENVTQAVAADVLRGTLVRLEQDGAGAAAHPRRGAGGGAGGRRRLVVRDAARHHAARASDWSTACR